MRLLLSVALAALILLPPAAARPDNATEAGIKDPFKKPKDSAPAEDCAGPCEEVRAAKKACDAAKVTLDAVRSNKKACKKGCQEGAEKMYAEAVGGCDGACREQVSRWLSNCLTDCANEYDEAGAEAAKTAACKAYSEAKSATKCSC